MPADATPPTGDTEPGLTHTPARQATVVEFNCPLGEPKAQPDMMRLRSDLPALCLAALERRLDRVQADWDQRPALGVVLAAGGYPESYRKGDVIVGLDDTLPQHAKILHAGTRLVDDQVVTNGGRVLCAAALGDSVTMAQQTAYAAADHIHWDQVYMRRDIGYRAVAREAESRSNKRE
jgi:phosphoribosylamine--glycine ligase